MLPPHILASRVRAGFRFRSPPLLSIGEPGPLKDGIDAGGGNVEGELSPMTSSAKVGIVPADDGRITLVISASVSPSLLGAKVRVRTPGWGASLPAPCCRPHGVTISVTPPLTPIDGRGIITPNQPNWLSSNWADGIPSGCSYHVFV